MHWEIDLRSLENVRPDKDGRLRWPAGGRELLLRVLRDERATEAEIYVAATVICRMPRVDDAWAENLLAIAQTDDIAEHTRAKAIVSLGPLVAAANAEGFEHGNEPITEELFDRILNALYDIHADRAAPKLLRQRALEAFAHAPENRLEHAIRAAYSADDDWRATALSCMFHHNGFEREIIESLRSENLDIRAAAIRAAGPCPMEEAWPYIRAALSEPTEHKALLLAAIETAGHISADALDFVEPFAASDDEDIARAARQALEFLRWPLENWDFGDDTRYH